jgi:hypothetical protein
VARLVTVPTGFSTAIISLPVWGGVVGFLFYFIFWLPPWGKLEVKFAGLLGPQCHTRAHLLGHGTRGGLLRGFYTMAWGKL